MWYYFFAFKYRPNEGNNIFLNLVSVVLYSSFALNEKKKKAGKLRRRWEYLIRNGYLCIFLGFIIAINWASCTFILITEEA